MEHISDLSEEQINHQRVNCLGFEAGEEEEKLRDCVVMKEHSEA